MLYLLRPESERLVWDELKSVANDPVLLQEFLERTTDPDLTMEAKQLMEGVQISSVRSSGVGDRPMMVFTIYKLKDGATFDHPERPPVEIQLQGKPFRNHHEGKQPMGTYELPL